MATEQLGHCKVNSKKKIMSGIVEKCARGGSRTAAESTQVCSLATTSRISTTEKHACIHIPDG